METSGPNNVCNFQKDGCSGSIGVSGEKNGDTDSRATLEYMNNNINNVASAMKIGNEIGTNGPNNVCDFENDRFSGSIFMSGEKNGDTDARE